MSTKEQRELKAIKDNVNALARKRNIATGNVRRPPVKMQATKLKAAAAAPAAVIANPHGDKHAAAVYLGADPADVPSHIAHELAVNHAIPDKPTGAVRNPLRDHNAGDMTTTIVSSYNLAPDLATQTLIVDVFPTLFYPMIVADGEVFVGGGYVAGTPATGYGNYNEALAFAKLCSSVCCEAVEVEIKYVGSIDGVQGEFSGACFAAGSSQLCTGVPRPNDLQSMMSYPGSKTCQATESMHFNLPKSEFRVGLFKGTSGVNVGTAPFAGSEVSWNGGAHEPARMASPWTNSPFNPTDFSGISENTSINFTAHVPEAGPFSNASFGAVGVTFPTAKFDILPVCRIVGGNLSSAGNGGSWVVTTRHLFTGTTLTRVGDQYDGSFSRISRAVTTASVANPSISKTSAIINRVGGGTNESTVSTKSKSDELLTSLSTGAKRLGSFLWNSIGGWGGVAKAGAALAPLLL